MEENESHSLPPHYKIDDESDKSYRRNFDTSVFDGDEPPTTHEELQGTQHFDWGSINSVRNSDKLEIGLRVKVKVLKENGGGSQLDVSTLLTPDDLAPIFSGAEWAGTRLWYAAIVTINFIYTNYVKTGFIDNLSHSSLIELGCGLGVPGLVAKAFGVDKVVLTDQESLLSLTKKNVAVNFPDGEVVARQLDWSREGIKEIIRGEGKFDLAVVTDCVYEPLYGKSWELLVEVCDELLKENPDLVCLHSMERRNGDGIDSFLRALAALDSVVKVEKVYSEDVIEIYLVYGR